MDYNFFQLCRHTPAEYAALLGHIHRCAAQKCSYEFRSCALPVGCSPEKATIGFWWDTTSYVLYISPAVRYAGRSLALTHFFRKNLWTFSSFSDMVALLSGLTSPAEQPEADGSLPGLFQQLRAALGEVIAGQEQAITAVSYKLFGHISKRAPQRPLSLIFYGPTGVGKSEMGKQIAPILNRLLGQTRYQLIWTELNTFTERHSVYRLTGSPPGYVGYDDPPVLEAVCQNPFTVFMFDELEKAHPEILKVFMSILDEGRCAARRRLSDQSRELDFSRCIFVFTTNADLGLRRRAMGFSLPAHDRLSSPEHAPLTADVPAQLARQLFERDEAARQALVAGGTLREIAGRFSGLIGFEPLDPDSRTAVTARQIVRLGKEHGLLICYTSPAILSALTPVDALSVRSTVAVLEGLLTPLFLACTASRNIPLSLIGTAESMCLVPDSAAAAAAKLTSAG